MCADRSAAAGQPWVRLYPDDVPTELTVARTSLVEAWRQRVDRAPDAPALAYFDGALTAREMDRVSDALAAALADRGIRRADRVGIHLQNTPAFPIAMLALWKLGAAAVPLNPMYRGEELRRIVVDATAKGVLCSSDLLDEDTRALADSTVEWLLACDDRDFQTRDDPRVLDPSAPRQPDDLAQLLTDYEGRQPPPVATSAQDVALLTYTSGTTGPPKGAMNTHENVLAVVTSYASWVRLERGDVVLAIAPLFHITGAVINATITLLNDTTLVLAHRFKAPVVLDAFAEHHVTFTIGSITAFNALMHAADEGSRQLDSVRVLYSGGAPIPPSTLRRFQKRFGHYIHNVYGMTETSSAVIAVPLGREAPVDAASGTLSVGVPLPGLQARVVDDTGAALPAGQQGELVLSGPQVVSGYWQNSAASAATMSKGQLRTGDVAIIDEAGWVYIVDRLKDQINVSGYKVWPREVEDALVEHGAVLEAAVVGRPDDYQGEAVVAHVALRAGTTVDSEELREFVRERLAAYKVPREVHVLPDLPKTQTGKIRRAALRQ